MGKLGEMDSGVWFDNALRSAKGWRLDAAFYQGVRKELRLRHAERMEAIAEHILANV